MKNYNKAYFIYFILILIVFLFGATVGYLTCKENYKNKDKEKFDITTPVEKEIIDTLYLTRDKIITKVKYLDSIKYDTIEKIYVLNDTASIELFYKLVSE